jgi:8-oxo-dGTP diphosphatase
MRRRAQFVLQMAGQPGSGKSTLARALAEHFDAVVIDKDILKSAVLSAGGAEPVAAVSAYQSLFELGESLVDQGFSVILDSPSYAGGMRPDIPGMGRAMAHEAKIAYCWIECECSPEELSRRVDSRSRRPSQYETSTSLDLSLRSHAPVDVETLIVNTDVPLGSYLKDALDYIYSRYLETTGEALHLPGLGVFAAVFDGEARLLCCRQNYGPRRWSLPGGAVEPGEAPLEGLKREVREETGLEVEPVEIIGIYSRPLSDAHVILFRAKAVGGRLIHSNDEVAEFFDATELPIPMGPGNRAWTRDAISGGMGYLRCFDSNSGEYEQVPLV